MEEYVWEYEWMEDNFTCVSTWKEVVITFPRRRKFRESLINGPDTLTIN